MHLLDSIQLRLFVSLTSVIATVHVAGAQQIATCGALLSSGAYIMDSDIVDCDQAPALTLESDATLDMQGHRLSCSDDANNGILLAGEGNVVVNGVVAGCQHGLYIAGDGGHVVRTVEVLDGSGKGAYVLAGGNSLTGLYLHDNDQEQLWITGDGNKVSRVDARGGNTNAVYISGNKNKVLDSSASNASIHGFVVESGKGNSFTRCISASNSSDGFHILGDGNKLTSCSSFDNGDDGFSIDGTGSKVAKCTSMRDGYGIALGYEESCPKCVVSGSRVIAANGNGMHLAGARALATKNDVRGGTDGMIITGGTIEDGGPTASKNVVLGASDNGVRVFSDKATISANTVIGAANSDLRDEDAACSTNTWEENVFATRFQGCEQ